MSIDGAGWTAYSGALTFSDGEHTVDLRASDAAGNRATLSQAVRVDTLPPDIEMSAGASFCPGCGETLDIDIEVQDAGSVVEWTLTAAGVPVANGSGPTSQAISWNGAGVGGGSHTLVLQARDAAGNSIETTEPFDLIVPAPPPEPPSEESSSGSGQQSSAVATTPTVAPKPTPTRVLLPTRTPATIPFGGLPAAPLAGLSERPSSNPPSEPQLDPPSSASGSASGVLWGAAALALIAGATAYGLDQARQRKEKEARLRLEMEGRNASAQAREVAHRAALAAAAAAKAAQEIQERRKVQYRLAQYQDSLSRLEPSTIPFEQTVAWQGVDPELAATYQLGRIYSSPQLSGEILPPPGTETPTPDPDAVGTPTPLDTPDQPTPARAPTPLLPPGYVPYDPDILSLQGKWLGRSGGLAYAGRRAYVASSVLYTTLEGGRIMVSAPSLARGTRAELLSKYNLRGGRYTRGTLSQVGLRQFTLRNLAQGARGTIGVGLVTSLVSNLWDFTVGTQRETGVLSKEFLVSTGVDLVLGVGTGLAAAGLVAGFAAAFTLTLPVSTAIALAAGIGLGIGILLDASGVGAVLKQRVNEGLEALPGIIQNGRVIAQVVGERIGDLTSKVARSLGNTAVRVGDTVGTAAREVAQVVTSTAHRVNEAARSIVETTAGTIQQAASSVVHEAQHVVSGIVNTASQAVDNARQFLGNLFGGGD